MNVSKCVFTIALAAFDPAGHALDQSSNVKIFNLPNSTQAPLWPPAELVDKDGDFVVVGTLLRKGSDGSVVPATGAALVSVNTTPPLNAAGVEDFSNPLGASYDIIRDLDLSPGSSDRNIELYSDSYGPPKGNFGGESRIPMEGVSRYNLNALPDPCPELFPTESQKFAFKRKSYPLGHAPILGFQGDQVAYDADTGAQYDPMSASGPGCGAGCSGENNVDTRPHHEKITLGEWLDGVATVKISLENRDAGTGKFTAAHFNISLKKAIPNGVYTAAGVSPALNRRDPQHHTD